MPVQTPLLNTTDIYNIIEYHLLFQCEAVAETR